MNQYHDDTMYRLIETMLRRLKAPVSLLLALAMFFIPLSDLSGMFAADTDQKFSDPDRALTISFIEPSALSAWTGEKVNVQFDFNYQAGSAKHTLGTSRYIIPLLAYTVATDDTTEVGVPIQMEVVGYTYEVSYSNGRIEDINGIPHLVLEPNLFELSLGQDGQAQTATFGIDFAFPNGYTPNEATFEPTLSASVDLDWTGHATLSGRGKVTETITYVGPAITAKAGETWDGGKQIATNTGAPSYVNANGVAVMETDIFTTAGYVRNTSVAKEAYKRVVYNVYLDITPDTAATGGVYGRIVDSSFSIGDLLTHEGTNLTTGAQPFEEGKDYVISSIKMGYSYSTGKTLTEGNGYTTDSSGRITFTTSEYEPNRSDSLPVRDDTSYWITVDYPILAEELSTTSRYTVLPNATKLTHTINNNVRFSATFVTKGTDGKTYHIKKDFTDHADVPIQIGWEMVPPGPASFSLTKHISVSGQNISFASKSPIDWRNYYNPTFSLYEVVNGNRVTPAVYSGVALTDSMGLEWNGLKPSTTYIVYEDDTAGFAVTYTRTSGNGPASGSMADGIMFTTPPATSYDTNTYQYTVMNTSDDGPAIVNINKYNWSVLNGVYEPLATGSVTFDVYSATGKPASAYLGEITLTATASTYTFPRLNSGSAYYLYETSGPANTILSHYRVNGSTVDTNLETDDALKIVPKADATVTYSAYNRSSMGGVVLYKGLYNADGTNVKFSGTNNTATATNPTVTYNIYNASDTAGATIVKSVTLNIRTTDRVYGYNETLAELPAGDYYALEASINSGSGAPQYQPNGIEVPFTVVAGTVTRVYPSNSDGLKNISNWRQVALLKTDSTNGVSAGTAAINGGVGGTLPNGSFYGGVEYKAFKDADLINEYPSSEVRFKEYSVSVAGATYVAYSMEVLFNSTDGPTKVVYVAETKAPTGFSLSGQVREVVVRKDTTVPYISWFLSTEAGTIGNRIPNYSQHLIGNTWINATAFGNYPTTSFTITKKGLTADGNGVLVNLSDAEYAVFTTSSTGAYIPVTSGIKPSVSTNVYTITILPGELPAGTTKLFFVESKVPGNYQVPSYWKTATYTGSDSIDWNKLPARLAVTLTNGTISSNATDDYNIPTYELRVAKSVLTATGTKAATADLLKAVKFAVYEGVTWNAAQSKHVATISANSSNVLVANNSVGGAVYWVKETVTHASYFLAPELVRVEIQYGVAPDTATTITYSVYANESSLVTPISGPHTVTLSGTNRAISLPFTNPEKTKATLEKYVGTNIPGRYHAIASGKATFAVFYQGANGLEGPLPVTQAAAGTVTLGAHGPSVPGTIGSQFTFEIDGDKRSSITIEGLLPNLSYVVKEIGTPNGIKIGSIENTTSGIVYGGLFDHFNLNKSATTRVYNDFFMWEILVTKEGFVTTEAEIGKSQINIINIIRDLPGYFNAVFAVYRSKDADADLNTLIPEIIAWTGTEDSTHQGALSSGWIEPDWHYWIVELAPPPGLRQPAYNDGGNPNNRNLHIIKDNTIKLSFDADGKAVAMFKNPTTEDDVGDLPTELDYIAILLGKVGIYGTGISDWDPLAGIVFYVYDANGNRVTDQVGNPITITTGTYGNATSHVYTNGMGMSPHIPVMELLKNVDNPIQYTTTNPYVLTFYLEESNTVDGYLLLNYPLAVTFKFAYDANLGRLQLITDGMLQLSSGYWADVTYLNAVIKNYKNNVTVNITKKSGDATITSGLAATFAVYTDKACTVYVTGFTTASNGTITLSLPPGTYWLKEITPLADHILIEDPIELVVPVGSTGVNKEITNTPYGRIKWHKSSAAGVSITDKVYFAVKLTKVSDKNVLTGVELGVYGVHNLATSSDITYDGITYKKSVDLSYNTPRLEDGWYLIQEEAFVTVPSTTGASHSKGTVNIWVQLSGGKVYDVNGVLQTTVNFAIPNPMRGAVAVTKMVYDYNNTLKTSGATATFTVYSDVTLALDTVVTTFTVGASATNWVYLNEGKYWIAETAIVVLGSSVDEYKPLDKVWEVDIAAPGAASVQYLTIDSNGYAVTRLTADAKVPNYPTHGGLKIFKEDRNGQPLLGATFKVYAASTTMDTDPTPYYIGGDNYYLLPATFEATVDVNGVVSSGGSVKASLAEGSYLVFEVTAPTGYALSGTGPQLLTITNSTAANAQVNSVTFKNPKLAEMALLKYDATAGEGYDISPAAFPSGVFKNEFRLEGAAFAVYYSQDNDLDPYTEVDATPYLTAAGQANLYHGYPQTDDKGIIQLVYLTEGFWKLVEIKAPSGFKLDNTINSALATTSLVFEVRDGVATGGGLPTNTSLEVHGIPANATVYPAGQKDAAQTEIHDRSDFMVAPNESFGYKLTVVKRDGITGVEIGLTGAVFHVYTVPSGPNVDPNTVAGQDAIIADPDNYLTAMTDPNNDGIYVTSRLNEALNGLLVIEVLAPVNYVLDPNRSILRKYIPWNDGSGSNNPGVGIMEEKWDNFQDIPWTTTVEIDKDVYVNTSIRDDVWQKAYNTDVIVPRANYPLDIEDTVDPYDLTLFMNEIVADYRLQDFAIGSNGQPLDYFVISDGPLVYRDKTGTTADTFVTPNDGYTINSVTVGAASAYSPAVPPAQPVRQDVWAELLYTTEANYPTMVSLGAMLLDDANGATFDLTSLTNVVAFEVHYGSDFTQATGLNPKIGTEFIADPIYFNVTFAQRPEGPNVAEIREIGNTGYVSTAYTSYNQYGVASQNTFNDLPSDEVLIMLPPIDTILPYIEVDKQDPVSMHSSGLILNGNNVQYEITLETYAEKLYQPILVDVWNTNQELIGGSRTAPIAIDIPDIYGDDRLAELGTPVATRTSQYSTTWQFPGYLEPGKPVTVVIQLRVLSVPLLDPVTGLTNIFNQVFLTSGKTLTKSAENPLGLSFLYGQNGAADPNGHGQSVNPFPDIDKLLNDYDNNLGWESYYADDAVSGTIEFVSGLALYKQVEGDIPGFSSAATTTYDGIFTYRLTTNSKNSSTTAQTSTRDYTYVTIIDHLPQIKALDFTTDKQNNNARIQEWESKPVLREIWIEDNDVLIPFNNGGADNIQVYIRTADSIANATVSREAYQIGYPDYYRGVGGVDNWKNKPWADQGWLLYGGPTDPNTALAIDVAVDYGNTYFDDSTVRYLYMEMKVSDDLLYNNVLAAHLDMPDWNDSVITGYGVNRASGAGTLGSQISPVPVRIDLDGPRTAIGNFIWEDQDGDGKQGANEPAVGGMIVTLTVYTQTRTWTDGFFDGTGTAQHGSWSAFGPVVETTFTTTTNEDGYYWFADQAANAYLNGSVQGRTYTEYVLTATIPAGDITLKYPNTVDAIAYNSDDFFFTNWNWGTRHDDSDGIFNATEDRVAHTVKFEVTWDDVAELVNKANKGDGIIDQDMMVYIADKGLWQIGDPTWDFGIFREGTLGNYVWYDNRFITAGDPQNTEPDGWQTPLDSGKFAHNTPLVNQHVVGMLVELRQLTPNGTWITRGWTVTGNDGRYEFLHLPKGTYEVFFYRNYTGTDPVALALNPQSFLDFDWVIATNDTTDPALDGERDGHVLTTIFDQSRDSNAYYTADADDHVRRTGNILLGYADHNHTIDAGIFRWDNAIGDYLWHDINRDGIQDENPSAIDPDGNTYGWNGLLVELLDEHGNPVLDDNGNPRTTTTDFHPDTRHPGWYIFRHLQPGIYYVRFHLPNGYIWTGVNTGTIANDSNATNPGATTPSISSAITVEFNTWDMTWDAGFYKPADNPPPPYYNDHNTVITIPGGTPANTVLNFSLPDGQTVSYTVPVNIPADQSVAFEFDQNSTPLTNLPQLLTEDLIVKHPDLFEFDEDTPLVVIPATFDSATLMAIFWSLMFLSVLGAGAFAFRKRFHV